MNDLLIEFGKISAIHLLAVASPGPDFAMVLRQSITHGRKTAIWTAIGIGTGILLHVTYSLLGVGLLIKSSPIAFNILKYAGAGYLAWIGLKGLLAKPTTAGDVSGVTQGGATPSMAAAFGTGFLTNALNPKVTLFFVAVFISMISPTTPMWARAFYGVWLSASTMIWFTLVSLLFTKPGVRRAFLKSGHWFDGVMGVLLIALAVRLALAGIG